MIAVGLGILLMSATVMFHVAGTLIWARYLRSGQRKGRLATVLSTNNPRTVVRALFLTTVVILVLHVTEVCLWAVAYYCLPDVVALSEFGDCVYFSMVTYTTLGYGDIVIDDKHWRLLGGIQAMGGMLAFGWSSAMLFAVVQQLLKNELNQASD